MNRLNLDEFLEPLAAEVVKCITDPNFRVKIPETNDVDENVHELAAMVARSSNVYGTAARLAGIARAQAKLARGRYERKFKASRVGGSSQAQRDANAMAAASDEHEAMCEAEAIAELADALEAGARIASESTRKILTSAQSQFTAEGRGNGWG